MTQKNIEKTYLHAMLQEGRLVRWKDSMMPIKVYIEPFRWYEKRKQLEAPEYVGLIYKALRIWSEASEDKVRFQVVQTLQNSQLDITWRRVDRTSLGDCKYAIKDNFVYSAEITIGISDGLLHSQYQHLGEVEHTILHEIGHGLGLKDHSPYPDDIMYVPHQYGVTALSSRDKRTIKWLYSFPPGFSPESKLKELNLPMESTIDDLVLRLENPDYMPDQKTTKKDQIKPLIKDGEPDLETQQDILAKRGKFLLSLQNIKLPSDLRKPKEM